jgi:hypothetical protein
MIPDNVPTIVVIVKNGKGGSNKDSIPVYDRIPPGTRVDYLKNDALVRIVDPTYPGIEKYRKTWNGSTYVEYKLKANQNPKDSFYCELSGHLEIFIPTQGEGETETFTVISDIFQDGVRVIKLQKF